MTLLFAVIENIQNASMLLFFSLSHLSVKEKDDVVKEEPPQGELETLGTWQVL